MRHSPREMQQLQRQRRDECDRSASGSSGGNAVKRAFREQAAVVSVNSATSSSGRAQHRRRAAATSARPATTHCAGPTAGASSCNCSGDEVAEAHATTMLPASALERRCSNGSSGKQRLSASIGRLLRECSRGRAAPTRAARERTTALQQGPLIAARRRLCICIAAGCDSATPPHTHTPPAPPKQHGRAR
jgi:hypothetical protein